MRTLLLGLATLLASSGAVAQPTAFVDVTVLAMDGAPARAHQTVVVEDGRITTVGPVAEVDVPEGARRIEGGGTHTLLPGLADMHVHLDFDAAEWFPLLLARGVTTVLNMRGGPTHLALREQVRQGEVLGPTVYTSGPFVNEPTVTTPEQARAAVREHVEAGYDVLKIHGDLSRETFAALSEAAREAGLAVLGHAPRNLPLEVVVEERMAALAHAEEMIYTAFRRADSTEMEAVHAFAPRAAEAGLWVIPTLVMFDGIVEQWGRPAYVEALFAQNDTLAWLSPDVALYWREQNPYFNRDPETQPRIREMYEFQRPLVQALHEAGVRLMTGTDTPAPVMVPGVSLHGELRQLVAAGLTPYEALEAATAHPGAFLAEHVDADARFGQVRPGHRADLVLVEGDPLADLSLLESPEGVMVHGRWLTRAALDAMVATMQAGFAPVAEPQVVLTPEQLQQLEGTYAGEGAPFSVRVELRDGALFAVVVESGQGYRMVPVTPTQFRVVGVPQAPVVTFSGDGLAEAAVQMEGVPPFTLLRQE